MAHEPAPPCRITVNGSNCAPAFATSCTAAHETSDAASRQVATSAPPAAPATPASTAARMAPVSAPHGPGGAPFVGATVVVVDAGAVVVGAVVVVVVAEVVDGAVVEEGAAVGRRRVVVADRLGGDDRRDDQHGGDDRGDDPSAASRQSRRRGRRRRAPGARGYIPGIDTDLRPNGPPFRVAPELAGTLPTAPHPRRRRFRGRATSWSTPNPTARPSPRRTGRSRRWSANDLRRCARATRSSARSTARPVRPPRWIVDPIDGTKGYARGIPVWATLIALERRRRAHRRRDVGARARRAVVGCALATGAWRDGDAIEVSHVAPLEDAHLAYDSVYAFESVGLAAEFLALARRCWRVRGFGDFWGHMLVADGSIDIAVEVGGLAVWDLAAIRIVVEEAGGTFTDVAGVARLDGGDVISTNGRLHADVVAAFAA